MREEQADKIIELLGEIRDKLTYIASDVSSTSSNTDYTYNVKNVAEDILDLLKEKLD